MGYNGNGVVVVGAKDRLNHQEFYLYDTNNKILYRNPLAIDTFYKKTQYSLFKSVKY